MDNLFDEHCEKAYDLMEGILTEITDSNIVFETITSRQIYLANKPPEKKCCGERGEGNKDFRR